MKRRDLLSYAIGLLVVPSPARAASPTAVMRAPRVEVMHNGQNIWYEAFPGPPKPGDEVWYVCLEGRRDVIEWRGPALSATQAVEKATNHLEAICGSREAFVSCVYAWETF